MASDPRREPAYVLQEDLIRDFIPSIGREQWQVVYGSSERTPDSFAVFSALLPAAKVRHRGWFAGFQSVVQRKENDHYLPPIWRPW
jgi:hypothetical protein